MQKLMQGAIMSIKPIYKKGFVFCPPLPGKPDSEKFFDGIAPLEDRVVQEGQKGSTCAYYACNYIRKRIGKNPKAPKKAREAEIWVSELRKKQTALDAQKSIALELTKFYPSKCFTKADARALIKEIEQKPEKDIALIKDLFQSFINQKKYDNLFRFLFILSFLDVSNFAIFCVIRLMTERFSAP